MKNALVWTAVGLLGFFFWGTVVTMIARLLGYADLVTLSDVFIWSGTIGGSLCGVFMFIWMATRHQDGKVLLFDTGSGRVRAWEVVKVLNVANGVAYCRVKSGFNIMTIHTNDPRIVNRCCPCEVGDTIPCPDP